MSRTPRYPVVSLKPRREGPLLAGHLWVFSGAIAHLSRPAEAGDLVDVRTAEGAFLGCGYYHPEMDIAVRILSHDPDEAIDVAFLRRRLRQAACLREVINREHTNAFRLVHAEGDVLPGLVVDAYADWLVVQISTAGMERLRDLVIQALAEELQPRGILLRNDTGGREREGLHRGPPVVAYGKVPEIIEIHENDLRFQVDVWRGQKTGLFLDQREKRQALQKYAAGRRVLNCFSYTGGFGVYAAAASPATRVTSVDTSAPALETARINFTLNGLDPERHVFETMDAFEYLERAYAQGERFEVVVLDPPAFAKSLAARSQAIKAYRRLNTLGMRVLAPGGILVSCSCSGPIGLDDLLFQYPLRVVGDFSPATHHRSIIPSVAQQLGRTVQLLESFGHSFDHPINISMPETSYLKVIFCRVL
jgi:23S rRNA (cytosine1962-C5)-methyltransferase